MAAAVNSEKLGAEAGGSLGTQRKGTFVVETATRQRLVTLKRI
jgi:hypothetical protein